jgi:DeoR/GlpR family transcriptional regulator of sugar metabolism
MPEIDLPQERRQSILDKLRQEGRIIAGDLSALYGVSEDTIRRDLRDLAAAGLLKRVHGGALPLVPDLAPYARRERHTSPAKIAVAQAAAQLVQEGQVVIIGSGTTNHEIARQLDPHLRATIITASPQVAVTLSSLPHVDIILIGGRVNKQELVVTGAEAVDQLRRFRADLGFLGICSLHPEVGYTGTAYDEVAVERAIIEQCGDVAAVAVAEKLGTVAPYFVAPLSEITYLVTEPQPDAILAPYRAAGLEIILSD